MNGESAWMEYHKKVGKGIHHIRFDVSSHEDAIAYMKEHKLVATGFSREITLIDNGLTDDPEKFVTEIRIPVQRIWEA